MSNPEVLEHLDTARDPECTFDERFDAAMDAYRAAQSDGDQRDVLTALMALRAPARDGSAATFTRLDIAIASIEDEVGLADEARARLEECKEVASGADAHQRCRLAYYLGVSHLRANQVADAQAALVYYEQNLTPDCPPETQWHYEFLVGLINEKRSQWAEAERGYRRCVQMSLPGPSPLAESARSGLARICMTQGRFSEAVLLIEGIELAADGGYMQSYNTGLLAYACLGKLSIDRTRQLAARCIEEATKNSLQRVAANAFIAQAFCDWYEGDVPAAGASLRRSISIDFTPSNRECCLLLDAWFGDEDLPQVTCSRAVALAEFLASVPGNLQTGNVETGTAEPRPVEIDEPLHAVIAALVEARRDRFILAQDGSTLICRGESHDLRNRTPMRRVLVRLVEARTQSQEPVPTGELFEAGWPETNHIGTNGLRRVYSELHRLRKLGLEIESVDGGYRLTTAIVVERGDNNLFTPVR